MDLDAASLALDLRVFFRRQRPLRGGSLIVTIFGDSILPRGGAIALGSLIRLTAPFGLNERLVRTASARLAQAGWLEARRAGKRSEYRLSKSGRERFTQATKRIYGEPTAPWTGRWTLIVLPPMHAADRQRLRKELAWQGFGELSSGVFAHPEARPRDLAAHTWAVPLPGDALVFEANLANAISPAAIVGVGWDLADLDKRYQRFARRFERARAILRPCSVEPETAFILRTLLIHEYRRLHLRDPLLPRNLLPAHWAGIRAAELCRDVYRRVFAPSELYLSEVGAQLGGALPPPDRSIKQRFGGLLGS